MSKRGRGNKKSAALAKASAKPGKAVEKVTSAAPTKGKGYVVPSSAIAGPSGYWLSIDPFEKVPELQHPQSVAVFLQMQNDDTRIESLLSVVAQPILKTPKRIDPNGAPPEVAEFVSQNLNLPLVGEDTVRNPGRRRGRFSFEAHLAEAVSPTNQFGHAFFEQIYRQDKDGRYWIRKLESRPQWAIRKFNVAPDGGLESIEQPPPAVTGRVISAKKGEIEPIPIDRLVVYTREMRPGKWMGRSLIRSAYKHWILKNQLMRVQAASAQRNGMGVPVGKAGTDDQGEVDAMKEMASAYQVGLGSGIGLGPNQDLKLLGVTGSLPDTQTMLVFHDKMMALAPMAHFLNLDRGGSHALATVQQDPFTLAENALLKYFIRIANEHIVEDLVDINFGPDVPAPLIVADEIGAEQEATAAGLKMFVEAGLLSPDVLVEQTLRQRLGLPAKPEGEPEAQPVVVQQLPAAPPDPEPVSAKSGGFALASSPEVPKAPVLATVAGVELGSVGFWDVSNQLGFHPTSEEFAACIAALDCPAVRRPVLKFGHTGEPGEGDPCIGTIDNMRLTEDGQTLVGDFVGVPGWLAEADDEGRSVIASAYPDRSGEWQRDYVCQLGHTHPFVLRAMSLLGVIPPGIGTLESLYDLYTKPPQKEETVMTKPSAVTLSGTTADQIRKAYYEAEPDWYLWIREMFVEPPELIVQDDHDDSLLRVPYTITGDGEVEFGDGQSVKVEYVTARATSEKPALVFRSRAEARPAPPPEAAPTPTSTSAAEAEDTQGKEGTMPTLKEGLVQKLGIAADATDETALQALDEALAERADTNEDAPAGEATPEQIAAAAKKLGLTVLETGVAQQLASDAAAGREARDRQQRDDDARVVDTAISQGRITPARRDHFLTLMSADREGTTTLLEKTLQESAVPLTPIGYSTEPDETVAQSAGYKNWRKQR